MGWYIGARNAVNKPGITMRTKDEIFKGLNNITNKICEQLTGKTDNKNCIAAFDGYIGADFRSFASKLGKTLKDKGIKYELVDINSLYISKEKIKKFEKPYMTDDPSFGVVCNKRLKDIMEPRKVKSFKDKISGLKRKSDKTCVICHGPGAAVAEFRKLYDLIFYLDVTRETTINRIEANVVAPVGSLKSEPLFWKTLYYIYYPMLLKQKKYVLGYSDYYIDDNNAEKIMLSRKLYDHLIKNLVNYPLKFKKIFMTGPWGGMWMRKYYDLPHLHNMCWNIEVSGMDSSLLIDVGLDNKYLDLPFWNLYSKHPIKVIGPYCHKKYPGNFPIQVGLQDGYFPKPVPHVRRAMPLHLHPDTRYIKKNFKESVGRYEVYYIARAFEGANTMQGFHQDADLKEFREKIIEADEKKTQFDWSKYIKCWPSEEEDLYIITAGTPHGTGGNQIVVEMDTCPSVQATEYSFFIYDYQRSSFDDRKKTFTGKPLKTQVKHGLKQIKWFLREKWVKKNLRKRPKTIRSCKDWSETKYDSYYPMPYEIGQLNFQTTMVHDTKGRFFHYLCLSKGERAKIRSLKYPEREIELEYLQSTVIPAGFGKYECINTGKDKKCTLVMQYWKKG